MKILILALIIFSAHVFGTTYSVRIDTSSSNIPTTFGTGSTSKNVLVNASTATTFVVDNRTGSEIAVNCNSNGTTAPSGSSTNNIYVAGDSVWSIDTTHFKTICYLRSMTGSAISSGIVTLTLIGGY